MKKRATYLVPIDEGYPNALISTSRLPGLDKAKEGNDRQRTRIAKLLAEMIGGNLSFESLINKIQWDKIRPLDDFIPPCKKGDSHNA